LPRPTPVITADSRSQSDCSREIQKVLFKFVAQGNFHKWRHERVRRFPYLRLGPATENEHYAGAAPEYTVDHMIELEMYVRILHEQEQSSRWLQARDLELLGRLAAEKKARYAQLRTLVNRARRQQFDASDRTDYQWPFHYVGYRFKSFGWPRCDSPHEVDLHCHPQKFAHHEAQA